MYWAWCNAAFDLERYGGRQLVWLNMDETMIAYNYAHKKGTVADPKYWDNINASLLHEGIDTGSTRTNLSLLACMASDPMIQQRLPQVIKAKSKVFPQYLRDVVGELCPENVTIWCDSSAWNTQKAFEAWVLELARCLAEFEHTHRFILVVDASKTHINRTIALACYMIGLVFVLIPGGLTWMLQPCDVYLFASLKKRIRDRLHAERLACPDGQLQKVRWLVVLLEEVGRLRDGDHAHSFARLGLDGRQSNTRAVNDQCIISERYVLGNSRSIPSLEELLFALGRKTAPFYDDLMLPFIEPAAPPALASTLSAAQRRRQLRIVTPVATPEVLRGPQRANVRIVTERLGFPAS